MKQVSKNPFYLLLVMFITITFSSCGNDENGDENRLEPIGSLNLESASNDLAKDGSMIIKFTVQPAGAKITSASIGFGEDHKSSPIEVTGLSSEGNGTWKVQAKVIDFTRIEASQTLQLTAMQEAGGSAHAELTLNDPYAINNKYGIVHPHTVSCCRADDGKIMSLPVIITATEAADLTQVSNIKVTNSTVDIGIQASDFMFTAMKDETGILLAPKPETVEKLLASSTNYTPVSLHVWITGANGRSTHYLLSYVLCSPSQTVTDDRLTVSLSDLKTPDFEKSFDIDIEGQLKRLGLFNKEGKMVYTTLEIGLLDATGANIEEDFIIAVEIGNTNNVTLSYDPNHNFVAGSYKYVMRYSATWKYNDKEYPRICGDLKYDVTLK